MHNHQVEMVREHLLDVPALPLPEGFRFRTFRSGDEAAWTGIIRAGERFFEVSDDLFARQFGDDIPSARERVYFVEQEDSGTPVATISAWYGDNRCGSRCGWGRIHWVATHPDYQGRGIGQAALSFALEQLHDMGHTHTYLVTSTGRTAALKMYLRYGFSPDLALPDAPDAWREAATHPELAPLLSGTLKL